MMQEYHYVYKITNTNPTDSRKYYIGVRTSVVSPNEDIKYMGSSKHLKKAILKDTKHNFMKEIIEQFSDRISAEKKERELLVSIDAKNNPSYYNLHNATEIGFSQKGKVLVIDTMLNIICSIDKIEFDNSDRYISLFLNTVPAKLKNDQSAQFKRIPIKDYFANRENYVHPTEDKVFVTNIITGEKVTITKNEFEKNRTKYMHATNGQVTVFDTRDSYFKNVSKDDFYKFDHYHSINKNRVNVIDKKTGRKTQVSKEEYYSNDNLDSLQTNLVAVIDTRDGLSKKVTRDEYHNNDFYLHHTNKTIQIFNENDDVVYTSTGNFKNFCDTHNLSYQILCMSYKKGGEPIFQNISKISYDRLRRSNREFQIGWYAKIISH